MTEIGTKKVMMSQHETTTRKALIDVRNVVNGVVVGLTVAVCLGVYDQTLRIVDRRQQIGHIRTRIASAIDRIRDVPDSPDSGLPEHVANSWNADQVRRGLFAILVDDIEREFGFRSSEMSLDEKDQLLHAIDPARRALGLRSPLPMGPAVSGLDLYEYSFDAMREIGWLGLPSKAEDRITVSDEH